MIGRKIRSQINIHSIALWLLPVLLVLVYILPLSGVVGWSFTRPEPGIENYIRLVTDPDIMSVFIRTARICLTVTIIAVSLAYLLAWNWVYSPPSRRLFVELCIFIPFWISVLIRAFGWVIILGYNGIINELLLSLGLISAPLTLVRTELAVIIGMVHFMVPFAVLPIASMMRQIDSRLLLASRGMGASQNFTFFNVFLPLTIPGVLAATIIVFVFSLGFFITPAILGGGRVVMVAEFIYVQMFQTSNWGLGATLSIAILVLVAILGAVLFKVTRPERLIK